MIRQHSVHLCHFPWAGLKGAEGQRGQRLQFALQAHASGVACYRFIPNALGKFDGRHVQRLLQSRARAHPAQVAAGVILRRPALAIMGKRRRRILHSRESGDDRLRRA